MQQFAISAHRDGFRRAGRFWDRKAVIVSADELTEEQLEQLEADPNITVTPCAPEGQAAAGGDQPGGAPTFAQAEAVWRSMTVEDLRMHLIRAAMRGLDRDNPDHFTNAGLPEIAALKQATGLSSIAAAERDDCWAREQA